MKKNRFLLAVVVMMFTGCASAVYNYDYGEPGSSYQYPSNVSIQFTPGYIPVYPGATVKVGAGMDVEYLFVPMGSDIFIFNKDVFASLRIGNQWSTIDNEVIGAEAQIGANYHIDSNSVISFAVSYTNLDLTTRDVIKGKIAGGTIKLSKILFKNDRSTFMLDPVFSSLYFTNNMRYYDFSATTERHVWDSAETDYTVEYGHPAFKNYLWAFGLGVDARFQTFTWYLELGKVFPKFIFDTNNDYAIHYDYYLTSGLFLNF